MTTKRTMRPLDLTETAWRSLDRLAIETNSTATRGSRHGKPSWRALIRRLAEGELALVPAPPSCGLPLCEVTAQPLSAYADNTTETTI